MSITEDMKKQTDTWAKERDKANDWLAEATQEEIFAFLNERKNLCTPGFLLRRQLQTKFPALIEKASKVSNVKEWADLTTTGNVPWHEKLIESLAKNLTEVAFEKYGNELMDIEKKQWQNYLSDQAHCNRNTAIKLIFALEMDDATSAKFLLSNGNNLLSLRNPFDYSCKACLNCGLTYSDAIELFETFDAQQKKTSDDVEQSETPISTFTELIKSETAHAAKIDTMPPEKIKAQLLKIMIDHQNDFTEKVKKKNQGDKKKEERETRYAVGYSMQNIKRLQLFLKYLTLLYPTFDTFETDDILVNKPISTDENGVPKVKAHLTSAIFGTHEIELPEYGELEDYAGPKLSARGELKRLYDNIPFNKKVLIPLKGLSKTLRSILRAVNHPENAQDVNRETILLLTYFLITGFRFASDKIVMKFKKTLNADKKKFTAGSAEKSLLVAFEEIFRVVNSIKRGTKNPMNVYITVLNKILVRFDFDEFYAPFVLDRFILLSLLSIRDAKGDFVQFFMQAVISESYRLSKELMEEKK